MGFGEFLRTRPFEPFGMRDTAFRGAIAQDRAFRLLLSAETGAAV